MPKSFADRIAESITMELAKITASIMHGTPVPELQLPDIDTSDIPLLGPAIEALETMAELLKHIFTPLYDNNGYLSPMKAMKMWASIPGTQLLALVSLGAPAVIGGSYALPKIPAAMKEFAEIDFHFTTKQKNYVKYSVYGSAVILSFLVIRKWQLLKFLEVKGITKIPDKETETVLINEFIETQYIEKSQYEESIWAGPYHGGYPV